MAAIPDAKPLRAFAGIALDAEAACFRFQLHRLQLGAIPFQVENRAREVEGEDGADEDRRNDGEHCHDAIHLSAATCRARRPWAQPGDLLRAAHGSLRQSAR